MAENADPVSYEDLAAIEDEYDEIDLEIMRQQYRLSAPVQAKQAAAVARIPSFWPLVFEQAPPEIDQYIQPQDSRIFAESLTGFSVTRPELDADGASGNPRSVRFRFEFAPNEYFEDTVLEKTAHYRRTKDGWGGLVSEPVRIRWKAGKDITSGLTDLSAALFEARSKAGKMSARESKEYTELKKKVEHWNGLNTSFFTWFGWISGRRWVSKEEGDEANAALASIRERRKRGEQVDLPQPELDEAAAENDSDVEVHQEGEELTVSLADELWPSAIKLFTQAQEIDELSDADFEEAEDDDDDVDEEGEPVDLRSLVSEKSQKPGSRGSDGPPAKKQKK